MPSPPEIKTLVEQLEIALIVQELLGDKGFDYPITQVGKGYTSTVYKTHDEKPLAVKILKSHCKAKLQPEVSAFELLGEHPHIIYYFSHSTLAYFIVMEYASKSDLFDYLLTVKQAGMQTSNAHAVTRIKYMLGLAKALAYLRSKRVLHRDVKPESVLIGEDGEAKLTDFGFAHQLTPGEEIVEACKLGTLDYSAPEILPAEGKSSYSYASDIWSFSTSLWFMYSFHNSYPDCRDHFGDIIYYELVDCLSRGEHPQENLITDEPVRELALKMWNMDPKLRPSAADAVKVLEQTYKTYQPG